MLKKALHSLTSEVTGEYSKHKITQMLTLYIATGIAVGGDFAVEVAPPDPGSGYKVDQVKLIHLSFLSTSFSPLFFRSKLTLLYVRCFLGL